MSSKANNWRELRAAHKAVILVLKRTHHGGDVLLFTVLFVILLLLGRVAVGQFSFVYSELDGAGGRLGAQVVHASLQTLIS